MVLKIFWISEDQRQNFTSTIFLRPLFTWSANIFDDSKMALDSKRLDVPGVKKKISRRKILFLLGTNL